MEYDEIRPYNDEEAVLALKRISEAPELKQFADFLFPGQGDEKLRLVLKSLKGVDDFQSRVMSVVVRSILEKTSAGVVSTGIENVKNGKKHIIISNHRDIILDPAIIQLLLFDNGVSTTEIAVGDNLIASRLIEDIFRSNRMIKVVRGGTPREKYDASSCLSGYLRQDVCSGKCSVWIAQRNGRAKDGYDKTEQGLLKMLSLSGNRDFISSFSELSILPVSVSYQFEPCDFLKARELYITRRQPYVKAPGEDTNSILTGVMQPKGGIDFHFSPELPEEVIAECAQLDKNERFKALAVKLDEQIRQNYKLWNNNYIAADLLDGTDGHKDRYTESEKEFFLSYMEKGLSAIVEKDPFIEIGELREIFLGIYARPLSL